MSTEITNQHPKITGPDDSLPHKPQRHLLGDLKSVSGGKRGNIKSSDKRRNLYPSQWNRVLLLEKEWVTKSSCSLFFTGPS